LNSRGCDVAIQQVVFRMSNQNLLDDTRTGGPSEFITEVPTLEEATALNDVFDVNAQEVFTHWFDQDRTMSAFLQATRYDSSAIDAMPPARQFVAVRDAHWGFAKVFAYLNVRLHSWGIFRRVAQHWFGESYDARKGNGSNAGALWSGLYRLSGATACGGYGGGRWPESTSIGTRAETNDDGVPRHPFWIDKENNLTIRPSHAGYECPVKARPSDQNDDWKTTWIHHWADGDPTETGYHTYGLPSVKAYWDIFFAPVPGLRFNNAVKRSALPSDLYHPGWDAPAAAAARSQAQAAGTLDRDLSLAEYIAAIGPLRLIREIRTNVYLNNVHLVGRLEGRTFSGALAAQFEAEKAREEANRARIRAVAGVVDAVASAIGEMPGPYTAAVGTIIGVAGSVGRTLALANITPATAPRDTFGEPVVLHQSSRYAPLVFPARRDPGDRAPSRGPRRRRQRRERTPTSPGPAVRTIRCADGKPPCAPGRPSRRPLRARAGAPLLPPIGRPRRAPYGAADRR
jgi:hypothetical protein